MQLWDYRSGAVFAHRLKFGGCFYRIREKTFNLISDLKNLNVMGFKALFIYEKSLKNIRIKILDKYSNFLINFINVFKHY